MIKVFDCSFFGSVSLIAIMCLLAGITKISKENNPLYLEDKFGRCCCHYFYY